MIHEEMSLDIANIKLDDMDYSNLASYVNSPVIKTFQKILAGAKLAWSNRLAVERDADAMRILQGQIVAANYLLNAPHILLNERMKALKKEASVHQNPGASRRRERNKGSTSPQPL